MTDTPDAYDVSVGQLLDYLAASCFRRERAGEQAKASTYAEDHFLLKLRLREFLNQPPEENQPPGIPTIVCCGGCGQQMTLVRPGKHQCDNPNCEPQPPEEKTDE